MPSLQSYLLQTSRSSCVLHRRRYITLAAKDSKNKAAAAAAASKGSKGFGAAATKPGKVVLRDGCPCGSNKHYKNCCKPYHVGDAVAPTVEDTIKARFSAILKKDVSYLLKTTHPDFHTFHYGTEPGDALRSLQDDLWNTVDYYEYSNLRINQVQPSENPDEAWANFQYAVYDLRTPYIDDQGNKSRKVQIEQSKFVRDSESRMWRFAEYKMVEVPEALAKVAEMQARDMAAAAAASGGVGDEAR